MIPALALGAATLLCCAGRSPAESSLGPAARVNGVAIERSNVQQLVKGLARAEPGPPDSERIGELTKAALESLIDLELLYQEAVRQKIELPPGQVDREVAKVRGHFDSDRQFAEALASRGLTPELLRLDTRRTMMADRLLGLTVWRGLSVSSEEVESFYQANRAELSQPLDEIQGSIARMLLDDKKNELRAQLVDELRDKASIQRLPPFGNDLSKPKPGTPTDAQEERVGAGETAETDSPTPGGGKAVRRTGAQPRSDWSRRMTRRVRIMWSITATTSSSLPQVS